MNIKHKIELLKRMTIENGATENEAQIAKNKIKLLSQEPQKETTGVIFHGNVTLL